MDRYGIRSWAIIIQGSVSEGYAVDWKDANYQVIAKISAAQVHGILPACKAIPIWLFRSLWESSL